MSLGLYFAFPFCHCLKADKAESSTQLYSVSRFVEGQPFDPRPPWLGSDGAPEPRSGRRGLIPSKILCSHHEYYHRWVPPKAGVISL